MQKTYFSSIAQNKLQQSKLKQNHFCIHGIQFLTHLQLLTDVTGKEHMIINTSTIDETKNQISKLADENSKHSEEEKKRMSLIIDGASLMYALKPELRKDFIELCCTCKTVICCRVSPIQVREDVSLLFHSLCVLYVL